MDSYSAHLRPAFCFVLVSLLSSAADGACEADTPARPVPQFDETLAPGVSLWPLDPDSGEILLRLADVPLGVMRLGVNGHTLPALRDSTSFTTTTIPGAKYGYEIFHDVTVPGRRDENASQADWVFVVYNAGLAVWDLRADPENPTQRDLKDGWPDPWGYDEWVFFPNYGEHDFYLNALDVIRDGDLYYIAIAGRHGAGLAIWTFDSTTFRLTQNYQDPENIDSYDVSLVWDTNGRIYAYAADQGSEGDDGGVKVYDVTEATSGAVCVEPVGWHKLRGLRGRGGRHAGVPVRHRSSSGRQDVLRDI
ncbi:MAG: hypothetical protein MPN21_20785 [Thermoanaerobaculia bacterium]|nr:hypothetical protein [Thermoanaerobaculia bacterium]